MTQHFLVLVHCARNYIVAHDTKKKLIKFFAWHLAEGLEPFSFEICVVKTNLAFQLGLQLSNLLGKV
jgi:hypothetical protein